MSLNFQAKKVESKRTIWAYSDGKSIGKWQLHKPVVAVTDDEGGVDTNTKRHTRTPSMPGHSSRGGTTRDSESVSFEEKPLSERGHTPEHQMSSPNLTHTHTCYTGTKREQASINRKRVKPPSSRRWRPPQYAERSRPSLKS